MNRPMHCQAKVAPTTAQCDVILLLVFHITCEPRILGAVGVDASSVCLHSPLRIQVAIILHWPLAVRAQQSTMLYTHEESATRARFLPGTCMTLHRSATSLHVVQKDSEHDSVRWNWT